MRKTLICISIFAVAGLPAATVAQDKVASAPAAGVQPLAGTSSQDYVAWAADGDMYEI